MHYPSLLHCSRPTTLPGNEKPFRNHCCYSTTVYHPCKECLSPMDTIAADVALARCSSSSTLYVSTAIPGAVRTAPQPTSHPTDSLEIDTYTHGLDYDEHMQLEASILDGPVPDYGRQGSIPGDPRAAFRNRPLLWYCCNCGDGPKVVELACVLCHHARCDNCTINK